jgi:hypothetical protein
MPDAAPTPAAETTPAKRMSLSQVVEHLLNRGSSQSSSVSLTRNAKGETQIEVVVRTDAGGDVSTIEDAETVAVKVYDRLRETYTFGGENGTGSVTS